MSGKMEKVNKKKRQPNRQLDCYGIKVTDEKGKSIFSEIIDESIMHELGDLGKW